MVLPGLYESAHKKVRVVAGHQIRQPLKYLRVRDNDAGGKTAPKRVWGIRYDVSAMTRFCMLIDAAGSHPLHA